MKTRLDALIVLGGGLILGFGGTLLLRAAAGPPDEPESEETAFMPARPAPASRDGHGAGGAEKPAPESDLRREMDGALAGSGRVALDAAAGRAEDGTPAGRRGWAALLTVYAMGDRPEEFRRAAASALRAGVDPNEVLDAARLFPVSHRADVLAQTIAENPGANWSAEGVAGVYFEAGDKGRAASTLATALEAGPHRSLIEQLVAIDAERAVAVLTKLAADKQWSASRLAQVADALAADSRADLAAAFLVAALEKDPSRASLVERLVKVAPKEGIAYARRLARDQPNNPSVWLSLGSAELAAGSASDAFEAYRQAASRSLTGDALEGMLRADPQHAYSAASTLVTAETDKDTLGLVARLAVESDRPKDASEALVRALQKDPSDFEWNAALVEVDPARAADLLRVTAQGYRGKQRDEVIGAYGDALLATGNSTAAFEQFREAFELDPQDAAWQKGLARSDPARAVAMLERQRKSSGDKGSVLGALADAYAATGRAEEARALYAQAVERGGGPEWWGRLALLDPTTARQRLEEATQSEPTSAAAWGALGDVLRAQGDATGSKAAYAKARGLDPKNFRWATRARGP